MSNKYSISNKLIFNLAASLMVFTSIVIILQHPSNIIKIIIGLGSLIAIAFVGGAVYKGKMEKSSKYVLTIIWI